MIIVSQDKLKTTENMELCIYPEYKDYEIIGYRIENNCIELGVYKTEERTKEILEEIIESYEISKRYECSSNNGTTLFMKKTFVYEMPED